MSLRLWSTHDALTVVRKFILAVFVVGVIGTGGDLLLLGHTEDYRQWIPLVLMGLSLIVLVAHRLTANPATVRLFQLTMAMFVISGIVGIWFHYQGNLEFELEMYPSAKGLELFKESLAGASPTLAPGAMLQLGLLGLVYTYRHPALG